jgi:hypothetical protein
MSFRRLGPAVALAAALCAVLALRVAPAFRAFRLKLVETPVEAAAGAVRVEAPGGTGPVLRSPVAVIARLAHAAAGAEPFVISIDGTAACRRPVAGGAPRRVDCAWEGDWDAGAPHVVRISGPGPFTLTYLEIATHYGSTRGHDLLIVPAGAGRASRVSGLATVATFLALTAIFLIPEWPLGPGLRRLHRAASALAGVLLGLVLISGVVSRYTLLISVAAFADATGVLAAPRLWHAAGWTLREIRRGRRRVVAAAIASALVVTAGYGALVAYGLRMTYHGNYSGFLQLSHQLFDRDPMLNERPEIARSLILNESGYDGQFVYFATFDPLLRRYADHPSTYDQFVDAPPYRYGRIGFSLLTRALAGSDWRRYPATMTWSLLAALFACALTLSAIAVRQGTSPAWGLVVLLVPGFWQSLQLSLPEPIAAVLLLGGYLCILNGGWRWAALFFGASLLFRETALIFVAVVAGDAFLHGKRREAAELVGLSVLPLVLWRLYVGSVLYSTWGLEAFWYDPHDLTWPLAGFGRLWSVIHAGTYYPTDAAMARAGITYPPLLIGGTALAFVAMLWRPQVVAAAAALYGALAVSLNYESIWGHVGNGQRGTYELFLMLALLGMAARGAPRALKAGLAVFWVGAAAYVFVGAFDAEYIRRALLAWWS